MSGAKRVTSCPKIVAIDLFCGVGGLSDGLRRSGISVVAGIDVDAACRFPFETNIDASFVEEDVCDVSGAQLDSLWPAGAIRLLAGCAPCQPFSPYRRGLDTSGEEKWPLLREFGRLVAESLPELVTMENVPRIKSAAVFSEFVEQLGDLGYSVDARSCYGPAYGLPQNRRRLILMASRLGGVEVPEGQLPRERFTTVRDAISCLPAVAAGEVDAHDPLHAARSLTPLNLRRIRASRPGGTWEDWPEELRADCHRKKSGSSFRNVYARMAWDEPSPTITTLSHNFGTGRFGHPDQDRSITLREAAILQGFGDDYVFVRPDEPARFSRLGRLIGNAVPPPIAAAVGDAFVAHVNTVMAAARDAA